MLDVAVVGMPDDRAGELPRAYVVCRPDSAVAPPDILKYVEGKFIYVVHNFSSNQGPIVQN